MSCVGFSLEKTGVSGHIMAATKGFSDLGSSAFIYQVNEAAATSKGDVL